MTDPFFRSGVAGLDRVTFDVGLRAHMQRIFAYMAGGLGLTGIIAFLVGNNEQLAHAVYGTPLRWVVMFAPFAFILFMNFRMQTISLATLQTLFWLYCGTMGLSLGFIFLVYTSASVAQTFFVSASVFGAMSLWGYTTKRDLTGFGSFLMMGVLGLILASLVSMFFASTMLQWMISVAGVAIFTGLTAWDVQRLKQTYAENYGAEANGKMAVFGALSLYMDFINLFMYMLRFMGARRD